MLRGRKKTPKWLLNYHEAAAEDFSFFLRWGERNRMLCAVDTNSWECSLASRSFPWQLCFIYEGFPSLGGLRLNIKQGWVINELITLWSWSSGWHTFCHASASSRTILCLGYSGGLQTKTGLVFLPLPSGWNAVEQAQLKSQFFRNLTMRMAAEWSRGFNFKVVPSSSWGGNEIWVFSAKRRFPCLKATWWLTFGF